MLLPDAGGWLWEDKLKNNGGRKKALDIMTQEVIYI
jgi:hypothetical protein